MLHFFQGSKLQMQCSTPEHTRGSQDGTTTPLLTGNKVASVMDKLKCSLLPEMKGEWLVGLLFLQCQCLVDASVNGMTFWGVLSATCLSSPSKQEKICCCPSG